MARFVSRRTDAARHAELTARFPDAYVIRAQAIVEVRTSLAGFAVEKLPARDAMFSLIVDASGFTLWAEERLLAVPWSAIGAFSLHTYVDYPIYDVLSVFQGHETTVLVIQVGERSLEVALWGDEEHDQTVSLLDEYGVRTVIARIERLRPGFRAQPGKRDALPAVPVERTVYPRFTWRRRR